MTELARLVEELRKKQQDREERERKEYRDRFWSKANDSPTRPDAPLK
jgi:hypothetical protein